MGDKKYHWIKLSQKFLTSDAVDFLMGQKNGSDYVLLYQMLCLKTANTNGRFERQMGEVIVQYDVPKIVRDCKYFSDDTVVVALGLYKELGLVIKDIDGVLVIKNHKLLVGSESSSAERVRQHRSKKALQSGDVTVTQALQQPLQRVTNLLQCNDCNGVTNVTCNNSQILPPLQCNTNVTPVPLQPHKKALQCNTEKEIDILDTIHSKKNRENQGGMGDFGALFNFTLEVTKKIFVDEKLQGDACACFDYYAATGFRDKNGNVIVDWRAMCRRWGRREKQQGQGQKSSNSDFDFSRFEI